CRVQLVRPENPDVRYDAAGSTLDAALGSITVQLFPGGPLPAARRKTPRAPDGRRRPSTNPVYPQRCDQVKAGVVAGGMTQRVLGQRLGVTEQNVSQVLAAGYSRPGLLRRMETYFGVAP